MIIFRDFELFQDFKIPIFQDFELIQDFKIPIFQDFEIFQDFKMIIFQDFKISRFQYEKMYFKNFKFFKISIFLSS